MTSARRKDGEDPTDAGTHPRLEFRYDIDERGGLVKSAVRALEVLELFDDLGRRAVVTEIADILGYPVSSTSVLLQTLAACGYLDLDPRDRSYYPTARVALLGHRTSEGFVTNGPILRLMTDISDRTGAIVILAARSGVGLKYINILQGRGRNAPHIVLGSVRPLTESRGGYAILSRMREREMQRVVTRIRTQSDRPDAVPTLREVQERIDEGRSRGYFFGVDPVVTQGAQLAAAFPDHIASEMCLIVGGPTASMQSRLSEIVDAISNGSQHHLNFDLIRRG
ncbi:IclR family transcriptional regulator [Sphingopyxis fribergensis]